MPPSTSILKLSPSFARVLASASILRSAPRINFCPPKPGFTDITSTWWTISNTSSSISTGVAGLITTPGWQPCRSMRCRVRSRCTQASWCTEIQVAPASAKAGINSSGRSIIKWQSKITSGIAARSDLTTGGPMVIFGTKWPSITSTCSNVPPASSAVSASTASCAKFADNIDGANSILGNAALLQHFSKDYTQLYKAIVTGVFGTNRPRRPAKNRVSYVGIVIAVIAGRRWHTVLRNHVVLHRGEQAPMLLGLATPRATFGNMSTPQIYLLGIEGLLEK